MSVDALTSEVIQNAKQQAEEIITSAELEQRKAFEEANVDAERKAQEVLRRAKVQAESVKRNILSEARRKSKLAEQEAKSRLVSEVLEEVRKSLAEIAKDREKYRSLLVKMIAEAFSALGTTEAVVQLTADDSKRYSASDLERELKKLLGKDIHVTWSNNHLGALGGACVTSTDGKIRMSNSLDDRFAALEPRLIVEAGRVLFSE